MLRTIMNNCLFHSSIIGHQRVLFIATTLWQSEPQSNNAADTQDILSLSAFLQHPTWPICGNPTQCRKPTVVHRPDVAVVFEELQVHVPNGVNKFKIPLLICEIEGSKDVWGEGEQESKAIEEACYSLTFLPENYILFVYPRRCELIVCRRNPYTGSLDLEHKVIYFQHDGDAFRDKMMYLCQQIINILVKQLTHGKTLIELAIPCYRQMGWDGINIFHPWVNVCNPCWYIPDAASATQIFNNNPNNIPQFE